MDEFLQGLDVSDEIKTQLDSKFQELNNRFEDVKQSRDKLKSTIKEKLEIDNLSQLGEKLNNRASDTKIAEYQEMINNLKQEVEARDAKLTELQTRTITKQAINESLSQLDVIDNPIAKKALEAALLEDTKIIDGKLTPMMKTSNGVEIPLMVDGKEISMAEKAKMLLEKPEYSIFKSTEVKRGVGSRKPTYGKKDINKMTLNEQFDYYASL